MSTIGLKVADLRMQKYSRSYSFKIYVSLYRSVEDSDCGSQPNPDSARSVIPDPGFRIRIHAGKMAHKKRQMKNFI